MRPQLLDEVGRVIALVGAERDGARTIGMRLDHLQRREPLGVARDQGEPRVDDQPGAVLHQPVADIAELRLHARPLAIEQRLGIGGRAMRRVRAPLALEVDLRVAPARSARRRHRPRPRADRPLPRPRQAWA